VWDSAALARCSSPYQRGVVADSQARSGQAVRFTGSAGFISMHDEVGIAPGRSRFNVRLRLQKGGHFATDFEAGGKGFQSRAPIEFADLPADGSFTERMVELNLPGPLNVVSLRGGLPKELVVDRITVEPAADASPVEVASLRVTKLVLAPGEAGEAGMLLANYSGRERSVQLRLVAESGINTEEVLMERDVTLPATTALQSVSLKLSVLAMAGYQLRAEALEGDKGVSAARDIFVVTGRPLRAGQYGNFSIHQPYSAAEADANIAAFRRNFVTVTEIDFWAPCDMSQLVPPPGKDRRWSGQTAQRFSTEQLRTCIAKAQAQVWKPTRAWLVSTERHRPFVEAVVGQTRRNDGREEPYLGGRRCPTRPSCGWQAACRASWSRVCWWSVCRFSTASASRSGRTAGPKGFPSRPMPGPGSGLRRGFTTITTTSVRSSRTYPRP
jgi:hypothetical protein